VKFLSVCVASLFLFSGCTSYFKRKSCEKKNWYEHGYGIAMSGKRLTGDPEYNACVKVDAEISHSEVDLGWKAGRKKYCSVDGAYKKGQDGQKYSFDYCDAAKGAKTRGAYEKGLSEFCRPSKAYSFAARGGVYLNVCSPEKEKPWMPEYKRGRVVFLKGEIQNKREVISQINLEITDLSRERRDIMGQLASLPTSRTYTTEKKYDPVTKTYRTQRKVSENDAVATERKNLNWELDGVARRVKSARKRQSGIRQEIHAMEREISALK